MLLVIDCEVSASIRKPKKITFSSLKSITVVLRLPVRTIRARAPISSFAFEQNIGHFRTSPKGLKTPSPVLEGTSVIPIGHWDWLKCFIVG